MVAGMTIIVRHDCVKYGSGTPGSSLDCPPCWEALQQSAFPEGPDLPRMIVRNSRGGGNISRESVEPERDSGAVEPFHYTSSKLHPFKTKPGGVWIVTCACGWSKTGRYARDEGETAALRLAGLRAQEHEDNPEKRCAFCGHLEREQACAFCRNRNES